MWPWEHVILGYVAYSAFCHLYYRDAPGGPDAFAVAFASALPDLIDKPLAWQFGVFDTSYALGHSIFFAVPLAIVVGAIAGSRGRPRGGIAFGLGYLLHLPSDVLDSYVRGGRVQPELMFWPLTANGSRESPPGLVDRFMLYFDGYLSALLAGELSIYEWSLLAMTAFAVLLWLYDGAPVLRECLRGGRRIAAAGLARVGL